MTDCMLLPRPTEFQALAENWEPAGGSKIIAPAELEPEAALLAEYLSAATGREWRIDSGKAAAGDVILEAADLVAAANWPSEHYRLRVAADGIRLTGDTPQAVARGVQVLRQMLMDSPEGRLPGCAIDDKPLCRWRGMHFDVSRHFFTVSEVCRLLDLMALHRLNVLHWHLTDDQGWRLEIKRYPRLTEVGSRRAYTLRGSFYARPRRYDDTPHGGFYTQEEIRTVLEYAARRRILVVPAIDMPGHMQAAVAAYPELGNYPERRHEVRCIWGISSHILFPGEETIAFIENVLQEVMELFPSPYIHLGADEAAKAEWEECRRVQERMAELGLRSESELQSYFIRRIKNFVCRHGRRIIGWDEVLEGGISPEEVIVSWRNPECGEEAMARGFETIVCNAYYAYLDYCQGNPETEPLNIGGDLPLEKAYQLEVFPAGATPEMAEKILGGQGQLWTEYIADQDQLDYMAFPRGCALAERLWTPAVHCRREEFQTRLRHHLGRLDRLGVKYRPLD